MSGPSAPPLGSQAVSSEHPLSVNSWLQDPRCGAGAHSPVLSLQECRTIFAAINNPFMVKSVITWPWPPLAHIHARVSDDHVPAVL